MLTNLTAMEMKIPPSHRGGFILMLLLIRKRVTQKNGVQIIPRFSNKNLCVSPGRPGTPRDHNRVLLF